MLHRNCFRPYNLLIFIVLELLYFSALLMAEDWQTYYEKSGKTETPRYEETMAYCAKLAEAAPYIAMISIGESPEGRAINMLILSKDRAFTAGDAHKTHKPIILIENCIHPGESEGKDASLMLARDLVIFNKYPHILDKVIIAIIPILNVDGHERFSAYNRINQNGPKAMGWRVTATRLNLNRDFMKADTPEMHAFLKMFNAWMPHLFVDCHTTNGADYQYDLSYNIDVHESFGGAVSVWAKDRFLPDIISACEKQGHIIGPYAGLIDKRNPQKGMRGGVWPARLSNPYCTLRNRAGLLIETHMLKPYHTRVKATYDFILAALNHVASNPEKLLNAIKTEENNCRQMGLRFDPKTQFALRYKTTEEGDSIIYRGKVLVEKEGIISGKKYITYEKKPCDVPTIYFNTVEPSVSVPVPLGYLVPQQWKAVIDVIKLHGIRTFRLAENLTDEFEGYRFSDAHWRETPYEGRHPVSFKTQPIVEKMTFSAGTVYVPLAQPAAKLVMHLLEPQAPDALIFWGFFDTVFERKEYFESYVMEPLAQKMADKNPELMAEFQKKLAGDSTFAANPRQRLSFFYKRSLYWDNQKDLYPVARLIKPLSVKLLEE